MNPFAAVPIAFWAVIFALLLSACVLMLVSMWRIYVKMGVPGWKSIVPFYSLWVLIDRLGKPKSWFWVYLIDSTVYMVLYSGWMLMMYGLYVNPVMAVLLWPLMIASASVMLIYQVLICHALSKAFGFEAGFTVGLILLPVVILPILAFGDRPFREDRPVAAP